MDEGLGLTSHQSLPDQFLGLSDHRYVVEPEQALLFLCANPYAGPSQDARLGSLLERPLAWDRVLDLSVHHGVAGLVRRRLRGSGQWERVVPAARAAMDEWHIVAKIRYVMAARQVACLLEAAAAAGIEPVLLKGIAAATVLYPDPTLREMGDIDVLVAPAERDRMGEVLTTAGYTNREIYYGDAFNSTRGYHRVYFDPSGQRLPVEVHWGLASRLERRNVLSAGALLRRTARVGLVAALDVGRSDARVLAPAARLVYLAAHAAAEAHSFSRLKWLADIAAAVGCAGKPNWADVLDFAGMTRTRASTFVALTLARNLLGAAVPQLVLKELRPSGLARWAIERTLNPKTVLTPLTEERRATVKYVMVDNPATTARLLRERLLPPPDAIQMYQFELAKDNLLVAYVRQWRTVGAKAMGKLAALLCSDGAGNGEPRGRASRDR